VGCGLPSHAQQTTETIVLVRHGEKTSTELGQLDARGLNRSLALPDVLIGKYGKPDYIFAPNPSVQINSRNGGVSYIRPLATIEPTAIKLGMPVNTQIGFNNINQLQTELDKPMYSQALVYVAWEHLAEDQFAKNFMKSFGANASVVPDWPGSDYDSIFVIRVVRNGPKATASFTLDHEGLNDKLSNDFPQLAPAR